MLPQPSYRRPPPLSRRVSHIRAPSLPAHLLASPATAAAQMLNIDLDRLAQTVDADGQEAITEEWVSEKSREELERLLVDADRTIKERERELGLAASIGKNLLERNLSLRIKHEALLTRVPAHSPSASFSGPPLSAYAHSREQSLDDWQSVDEPQGSTSSPSSQIITGYSTPPSTSFSASSPNPQLFTPPSARRRPATPLSRPRPRRTSSHVSPQHTHTLGLLSEQNASLQSQLEDLSLETAHLDRQGRRKLKKLEEELEGLKRELEETRVRNGELEEQVERVRAGPSGVGVGRGRADEEERDRWEVESAVVALRPEEPSFLPPMRHASEEEEFADSQSGFSMTTHDSLASLASSAYESLPPSAPASPTRRLYASPRHPTITSFSPTPRPSHTHTHTHTHSRTLSHSELNLVAQLVAKVSELERANREMMDRRDELEGRMMRLEGETRDWEGVLEGMEADAEADTSGNEDEDEGPGTVRPLQRPTNLLPSPRFSPASALARRRRQPIPRAFVFPARSATGSIPPRLDHKYTSMPNTPLALLVPGPPSSSDEDSSDDDDDGSDDPFADRSGSLGDPTLSRLTPSLRAVKSLGDELAWAEGSAAGAQDRRFVASPLLSRWKGKARAVERASTPPQVDPRRSSASSTGRTMEDGDEEEDGVWSAREWAVPSAEGEGILRLGELKDAEAGAFDELHQAIAERGRRGRIWVDEDDEREPPAGLLRETLKIVEHALGPAPMPDSDLDIWSSSRSSSPSPDSPSNQLRRRRRRPPTPLAELNDPRVHRMFGDMWVMLLFMWTVGVFVIGVARRGPRGVGMGSARGRRGRKG